MSQWRGRIEEIDEPADLVPIVGRYYHIPALLLLVAFMLWTRVRNWESFVVDGTVYYSGNDPWYHYRMVSYTVQNWPATSPFDPWTYFPFGTHSSQFGTVFDQLMATAALVVGLGNPSDHTVRMVVLFAPAVIGAATALPVYLIGKRAAGRFAGLVAVGILSVFGSLFVARGTVGFSDHHIAEVLFQTVAVLATMVAVSVAEEEKPVWELFVARDVSVLRRPVAWAVVAGAATALYIWTWPPGVVLIGILGVYYLVELSSFQAHGESPEPVAVVGAVSMLTTGIMTLAVMEEINVSATSFNLVQPLLAFLVAGGCVFMAWFAREWDDRDLVDYQYPAAVIGIIVVLAGVMSVALPEFFGFLVNQTLRVIGLSVTETAGTIGEAQPLEFGELFGRYNFVHFIALAGVALVGVRHILSKPRSELTLVAIWMVFMLLATLTQRRFDYYLGVTVAVMAGYTVAVVADFGNLFDSIEDIDTYQVISLLAIVAVVFVPFFATGGSVLAMQLSSGGPGNSPVAWNQSLGWMQENTPAEGNLEGAGNQELMEYYGTFESTDDYDYQPGFYGVMSWWDYGHWITVMGERIPNANPFQLGADRAANFLLATDEDDANSVLNELDDGNGTETRYVMVDWKMATTEQAFRTGGGGINLNGKYFAPFQFTDRNVVQEQHYEPVLYRTQNGRFRSFMRQKQPYYESMTTRLYHFHGSAIRPTPVVLDWELENVQGQSVPVSRGLQSFDNISAAREFADNDATAQVGGVGQYTPERVEALAHYRLVQTSQMSAVGNSRRYLFALRKVARGAFKSPLRTQIGLNQQLLQNIHYGHPNWVKVFERVPGATIQGEGAPANTQVNVAVRMNNPGSNTTFIYRARATSNEDGEFSLTVPYSTTGYDNWGPEDGYTDVEVRADTAYQVRTEPITNESGYQWRYTGTVNVTEGQVIGEDDSPATVTLERGNATLPASEINTISVNQTDGGNETTDGSTGEPTATPADTGATATPSDGGATATPTDSSGNGTAGSLGVGSFESLLALAVPLFGLPLVGLASFRRGQ